MDGLQSVCCYGGDSVPAAMLWGTIIFSLGLPGMKVEESPLVTRRPSGAMVALQIRNQISLFISPNFVDGTLPVVR